MSSSRLLQLPAEVQMYIFNYALVLEVHAGHYITGITAKAQQKSSSDKKAIRNVASPIYSLPQAPSLLRVNRHIRKTLINMRWRRLLLYVFPSTFAMLDVLTEWPEDKLKQISRMRVMGHMLPVCQSRPTPGAHDVGRISVTYSFGECLSILQGLELDLLEVHHPYPISRAICGGRESLRWQMEDLMRSHGWRELYLTSQVPEFDCKEVNNIVQRANQIREDEEFGDYGYDFDLPDTPVDRDEITGYITGLRCQQGPEKTEAVTHDVHCTKTVVDYLSDRLPKRRHLILACKRGNQANIAQEEVLTGPLSVLLDDYTWEQLRATDIFRQPTTLCHLCSGYILNSAF